MLTARVRDGDGVCLFLDRRRLHEGYSEHSHLLLLATTPMSRSCTGRSTVSRPSLDLTNGPPSFRPGANEWEGE